MTHSTLLSLSRRTLQLATLSVLAAASVTLAGEPVTSEREGQLMGHMEVTATRERPLIGSMVVTANRLMPIYADLGAMTVTAPRETTLARNQTPQAARASL
jgi:hypothetical protein